MKRLMFIGFLSLVFLFLSAVNSLACRCMLPEKTPSDNEFAKIAERQFENAIAIFSGEVIALSETEVTFKLEKVWKGNIKDEYKMSTGVRYIDEKTTSFSSCDYTFGKAEKYLVFAFKTEHNDVQTYNCSLTQFYKTGKRTKEYLDSKVKSDGKEKIKRANNLRANF